ncbi:type II secretion system protein GspL [Pseudomonas sp. JR33AA]|uniref:type II secretion system protein GspL n=1 Tax=Pseudomonas sp. JR33AA TaxID=2899113 RepID=UPI001F2CF497|nr:type II secretion system protein GspL [Pseudomonas sp. JR33AA]MCE5975621.1 type II secretion system protein GspL [Pseudomonas sp. JR33AA]
MSRHYLFLLAQGMPAAELQWPVLLHTAQGERCRTTLGALPAGLAGSAVVLVLPMEMAGCSKLDPVPGRRPTRESLAYAAEEQLAEALESLHLAFGPPDAGGYRQVVTVALEECRHLMSMLQAQGIDPVAVHVDADLLGTEEACALWFEGRWLLGGGAHGTRLAVSDQQAQVLSRRLAPRHWLAEPGSPGEALCDEHVASAVGRLMEGVGTAVDLRQGPMRRKRSSQPWQALAGSMLAALLLVCLADYLRAGWLLQQASLQHADNVLVFGRWAPGQAPGANLVAQVRALEQQPGPPTAVERLATFADQLAGVGNVTIERAEDSTPDGWSIDVVAQGFDDLERLRQRAPGVRMGHARQVGEGVRATLSWLEVQ